MVLFRISMTTLQILVGSKADKSLLPLHVLTSVLYLTKVSVKSLEASNITLIGDAYNTYIRIHTQLFTQTHNSSARVVRVLLDTLLTLLMCYQVCDCQNLSVEHPTIIHRPLYYMYIH